MVVLYVDPHAEARAARVACLEEQGFTVHQVGDAETAVGIAQELPRLDVLVCEGVLGEFTGFDLRDAITEKFPLLRTVFTSRYDLSGFEESINGCPLVYDPIPTTKLISIVKTAASAVAEAIAEMERTVAAALATAPVPVP
ncbi:MAG: hypothetical protein ACAI34_21435, partial [Verrucomicrobium sp.]